MRLHSLEHAPFESIANIGVWARKKGFTISRTALYNNEALPDVDSFDWLAVMGGPMNIYEHEKYPWLVAEKSFIKHAITAGKVVIGVCLGGQLIADVLGGAVTKNEHREIGYFPVTMTAAGLQSPLVAALGPSFTAFHWHGDRFSIPPQAVYCAGSAACSNQLFTFGNHVVAMQFHFDYSYDDIAGMVDNCSDELTPGPYVQQPKLFLNKNNARQLHKNLFLLLNNLYTLNHR